MNQAIVILTTIFSDSIDPANDENLLMLIVVFLAVMVPLFVVPLVLERLYFKDE